MINVDETNLSLDGSDGGHGGCPGCTITIKHCSRPGTAQNKSSVIINFQGRRKLHC
jgi:hypothetical protein